MSMQVVELSDSDEERAARRKGRLKKHTFLRAFGMAPSSKRKRGQPHGPVAVIDLR